MLCIFLYIYMQIYIFFVDVMQVLIIYFKALCILKSH